MGQTISATATTRCPQCKSELTRSTQVNPTDWSPAELAAGEVHGIDFCPCCDYASAAVTVRWHHGPVLTVVK